MVLGVNEATLFSPVIATFISSGHEPFFLCVSVSLFPLHQTHTFDDHNSTLLAGAARHWAGLCFLFGAQGRPPQACLWVSLPRSDLS